MSDKTCANNLLKMALTKLNVLTISTFFSFFWRQKMQTLERTVKQWDYFLHKIL